MQGRTDQHMLVRKRPEAGKNHPKGLEHQTCARGQARPAPCSRAGRGHCPQALAGVSEGLASVVCLCSGDLLALPWVLLQTCLTDLKRKIQKDHPVSR